MFNQSVKLYKTNDSGNTWNEINNTEKNVPSETKTWSVTYKNQLWQSKDGITWSSKSSDY